MEILLAAVFLGVVPWVAGDQSTCDPGPGGLESWRAYRAADGRPAAGDEQLLDELRLLEILGGEFDDPGFDRTAEQLERLELIALVAGSRELERSVRTAVKVAEEEVRAAFDRQAEALRKPKRWQLRDILVRFPEGADDEARSAALDRAAAIRREIIDGASFDEVARRESDSATRLRGGGWVSSSCRS